ncbi:2-amino-4-hydroxy-6-hydroxymethyldihydropteridine diphosphokinase [Kineococcus gynurae]|uniref:2-amino-4-hydroxy-6-hydroxymethyldihydropteridine diphosphokinase n=1 Tax=Kineococcus gynurae TaxID=452979 RepID=A0ABV5LTX2_9ACTN
MSDGPASTPVVLSLGANVGATASTLRSAVRLLHEAPGFEVTAVSSFLRTRPVGAVPDQPDFVNAVVLGRTTLGPTALLEVAHTVETALGLDRSTKVVDGPRVIDVDVVTHGESVLDLRDGAGSGLVLPHPRAHEREFVLAPWVEVDPDAVLPGPHGGRVADLLAAVRTATAPEASS